MKDELKNKLNHHISDIDPAEIWAAIEPQVDALNEKKKRKRRIFFLIFTGIAMTGLLWLFTSNGILSVENQTTNNTSSQKSASENYNLSTNATIESTNEIEKKDSSYEKPNELVIKSTVSKSINNQESTTKIPVAQLSQPTNISDTPIYSNSGQKKESATNTASKLSTGSNQQSATPNATNGTNKTISSDDISEYANTVSQDRHIQETSSDVTTNAVTTSKNESSDYIVEKNNLLVEGNTIASRLGPTERLTSPLAQYLPIGDPHLNYQTTIPPQRSNARTETKKYFQLAIGANSGIAAISRSLSAKNSVDNNYKMLRNDTETMLEAINAGIDLTVKHRSGFSISLGLNQVRINERFNSVDVVIDTSVVNTIKYRVINLMQDTVDVYGDVSIFDITRSTYKIYNQHRLTELPILLGYSYCVSKWNLGAQAGVLANIRTKSTGRIFNKAGEIIDVTTTDNPYKTQIGLGYQFGLSIGREVMKGLNIQLKPMIKIYPNTMHDDSALTNKYTLFGGQVGLTYNF